MKLRLLIFLIPLLSFLCTKKQESTWDGYWVMIHSIKDNTSYKELDINGNNIIIVVDGEQLIEKKYDKNTTDFTLEMTEDSTLIVSSIHGDKEIYKRINFEKEDKYFTRANLIRKYNYYIQSVEIYDSISREKIKDQLWEEFDLGGFNFADKDFLEDDFEIKKKFRNK